MTQTVTVKSYQRRKPEKPEIYKETHARLREELSMDAVTDRRARFVQSTEKQEGVLQRLLRVFVRK